jgi:basic amino acid/polyamine antiporter, APA family
MPGSQAQKTIFPGLCQSRQRATGDLELSKKESSATPSSDKVNLKKEFGLLNVFSLASGTMISSGLFVLPGLAYAQAGPAIILSYALAALLMIPVMLSKAELITAMPKAGGSYFYIERSLGPLFGSFAGLGDWLALSLKTAFALFGIGALASILFPQLGPWAVKLVAVGACLFFTLLNLFSVKGTGKLQNVLLISLLLIIIYYIVGGAHSIEPFRYKPFLPAGWQSVFVVAGMVFVSYGGLTKVVNISEEVKNPGRNLPLGMFLAFSTVSLLYIMVVFVTVGVLDGSVLSGSLAPISEGAKAGLGGRLAILIDIGALLAFATTANSGILSASRSPLAMSRDGLLPEFFGKTSKRFGTPYRSILLTTTFITSVILLLSVENLVKTASTMLLIVFILDNVCVIIMRQSGIQNYQPTFKTPFYPWLQALPIIIYGYLIFEMGRVPLLLTGAFGLAAAFWFLFYVRPTITRESAFVYLVKNLVARDIQRSGLEEELKQITLERDQISLDRFDILIKNALVIDLEEKMDARQMFRQVSRRMAGRLKIGQDELFRLLLEREKETSTEIRPGLAIPHVIIEGKNVFELAMVRSRPGVVFSDLHRPVQTAFVLVGSLDERNFHLRALMHIAHIVEDPNFEQRWLAARGEEELKDVVLLTPRRRENTK